MEICFVRCRDGAKVLIFVLICTLRSVSFTFLDFRFFLILSKSTASVRNITCTRKYMNESLPSKVAFDKSQCKKQLLTWDIHV